MADAETVTAEQDSANRQWLTFIKASGLKAKVGPWMRLDTEVGPLLSARVVGSDAAKAVQGLVTGGRVVGIVGGFHRPNLDYTVPGRIACVWQSNGVWVEFWHPDQPATAPTPLTTRPKTPLTAVSPKAAARQSLISRASGRLLYPRRKKESTSR
ncbi:hypothetical protein F3K34_43885 [Streptomyces sp. LBUM 1486]|uniref:hypothetical protein n=1 Tax=Streptomyces scabiei TaxID=1930 RepID=UPI001B3336EC|nr:MULTISPECIES: hypothetical protein [Streptomyces]MBP5918729.1 hypothetical protein [Streptomyces sp. LBUM 1486]MDX3283064.1 hypothetical protein [Streptomyces scabiei]